MKQIQLSAEHLAVVFALERLIELIKVEARQLCAFQQKGAADILVGMSDQLQNARTSFIRDTQRLVQVASELPLATPT